MSIYFLVLSLAHGLINFLLLPASIKYFNTSLYAQVIVSLGMFITTILLCYPSVYTQKSGYITITILLMLNSCTLPVFITSSSITCGEYAMKYTKNARTLVIGMARMFFNIGQIFGPILAVMK